MTARTRDAHRGPHLGRIVFLVLAGVLPVGLLGILAAGVGTASASRLGVSATDAVASGVAIPTRCDTTNVSTAPVFVDNNPTKAMSGVKVTGIPAPDPKTCTATWVLVTGWDEGRNNILFTGQARYTETDYGPGPDAEPGSVVVTFTESVTTATEVRSVQVTIL